MNSQLKKIIIIDDNESIHHEIIRILNPSLASLDKAHQKLSALHQKVFGNEANPLSTSKGYDISSAFQGKDGFELVAEAQAQGTPFAMAIVDMRMPPGWDGLQTIENIWRVAPGTQILICTAYSDYSWQEINSRLGRSDAYLILKKPFDITELEQMAAAMTAKWQLTYEREAQIVALKEAQLAAEAGLIAKRDFLAMMNHEFRTPMNAILGAIQFSKDATGLEREEMKPILETAERATLGLLGILDDILDYLNLEKGQMELRESSYTLSKLVDETCSYYRNIAKSRNTVFQVLPPNQDMNLLGDQKRIRQVLNHLLSNAVKHTKNGSITITTFVEANQNGGHVEITVKDSGEGMSAEQMGQIFESFQQGEDPLTRSNKGIGLGLSICKLILESMGGDIKVASQEREGSEFKISFTQKRAS